jgi:hypothetical protein
MTGIDAALIAVGAADIAKGAARGISENTLKGKVSRLSIDGAQANQQHKEVQTPYFFCV